MWTTRHTLSAGIVLILMIAALAGIDQLNRNSAAPATASGATAAAGAGSAATRTVFCEGSSLEIAAHTESIPNGLGGVFAVRNMSASTCAVAGVPAVRVRRQNGAALTGTTGTLPRTPRLHLSGTGQTLLVGFVWRNWCDEVTGDPLVFDVTLPWNGEILTAPLAAQGGRPATVGPPCLAPAQPATLEVGPFVAEGESPYTDDEL